MIKEGGANMQSNNQYLHLSIIPVIVFLLTISVGAAILISEKNSQKQDQPAVAEENSSDVKEEPVSISIADPVEEKKKLICEDKSCKEVVCNDEECINDVECVKVGDKCGAVAVVEKHLECVNEACKEVDGAGADKCGVDADCVPVKPVSKHLECVESACKEVAGEGANQCSTDNDCVKTKKTHLECMNRSCVPVEGAGENKCSDNSDCELIASNNNDDKPDDKPKPAVPETGSGNYLSYIMISALLLANGVLVKNTFSGSRFRSKK